jgi:outer membrane lipoprotein SlyB
MRTSKTKTLNGGLTVALLAGALALGGGSAANAGVTSCSASGGKQEVGAVIGAVAGGLLGHAVGGRHATGETVVGAAAGAAAGSAIGCEAQKSSAARAGYAPTYRHDGYRLQSNLQPARYERIDGPFVAVTGVTMRAAPSTNSVRVGRLPAGARFQALAHVRGTDWILVGQGGIGVGYVRGDLVRPAGAYRYAAY